jgi:hypothetical protein
MTTKRRKSFPNEGEVVAKEWMLTKLKTADDGRWRALYPLNKRMRGKGQASAGRAESRGE